jgi:hypothetical protein
MLLFDSAFTQHHRFDGSCMTSLWQRALAKRQRCARAREYQRYYRRRLRFELKVRRIRETFARVEALAEKLLKGAPRVG